MIRYIYVDLETTHHGGPEKDSPEAHWRDNKVVMCGYTIGNNSNIEIHNQTNLLGNVLTSIANGMPGDTPCIVAHNAKFDLKYLMRDLPNVPWHKVKVWDTMTWEYRHSGHTEKLISLEKLAEKYSIKFKKTLDLGDLISQGVKVQDIDKELLEEYLREDVRVLRDVHEAQLATGYECDMDYLLPLAEMELNGLKIDKLEAQQLMTHLVQEVQLVEEEFIKHIKQCCEWQDGSPLEDEDFTPEIGTKSKCIKPMAGRTLSFLLTGIPAVLQVTPKWHVQYKDGFTPYYTGTIPSSFKDATANLGYPVGESVLEQDISWIAKEALEHRKANKLLSTYVSPMLHTSKVQGTVHPKLNTAITATGRLSSSNPNGQNMPGIIRQLIVSNNKMREICEWDFSQLEMVGVACISGDRNLINDLQGDVDIHYNTAKQVFGEDNAETMRKIAKNVNFGLLYGGKANGLSYQTGVDKDKVQKLIDAFYSRYPGVARWQKKIFNDVVDNMYPYDVKDGEQRYASFYTEPLSGRRFKFIEQTSPPWLRKKTGRKFSFSPQQTSNYPIQGFAGGDIVMYALQELWKEVQGKGMLASFIMTVHDSIIMEVHPTVDVYEVLEEVLKRTKARFNLSIDLHCDVEFGPTWK